MACFYPNDRVIVRKSVTDIGKFFLNKTATVLIMGEKGYKLCFDDYRMEDINKSLEYEFDADCLDLYIESEVVSDALWLVFKAFKALPDEIERCDGIMINKNYIYDFLEEKLSILMKKNT